MIRIARFLLLPIAALYALIIYIRNRLFDFGILPGEHGAVRTIVIGNLAIGGTGKTPHTEYIASLLNEQGVSFAVLSRGYGRMTRGYKEVELTSTSMECGDEPVQIKKKFVNVPVVVCEDRLEGLRSIRKAHPSVKWVILDDAFQHRKLKGDLNILLTNFHNPFWKDLMLPTGNLRDNRREKARADIIVVTKCPAEIENTQQQDMLKRIAPKSNQAVFFSSELLLEPVQFTGPEKPHAQIDIWIGFAGLASIHSFRGHLEKHFGIKKFIKYTDHHPYSSSDLAALQLELSTFVGLSAALITTEKDVMRLQAASASFQFPVYYVPMKIKINAEEEQFRKLILDAVAEKQNDR